MPVRHARSETRGRPPFWPSGWHRQERFDEIPQRIWKQRGGHNRSHYLAEEDQVSEVLLHARTSRPRRRSTPSRPIPDDNRVLECAGSQTRSLDDDVLGTNPKYDWKRFGDSIPTLGQISSAAFVERRATEEGVDPVQNPSERGFAQAPHPSSRSLKEERTTTSDQHSETVH